MKKFGFGFILAFCLFASVKFAVADVVLYSNGPMNGTIVEYPLLSNYAIADSFTLAGNSTVTGVNFWAIIYLTTLVLF